MGASVLTGALVAGADPIVQVQRDLVGAQVLGDDDRQPVVEDLHRGLEGEGVVGSDRHRRQ